MLLDDEHFGSRGKNKLPLEHVVRRNIHTGQRNKHSSIVIDQNMSPRQTFLCFFEPALVPNSLHPVEQREGKASWSDETWFVSFTNMQLHRYTLAGTRCCRSRSWVQSIEPLEVADEGNIPALNNDKLEAFI